MCAKNALRRSARPARHIDAHSAGCGMLLVTLQAEHKTPGGACTAFAYHVMLSSIVLPAKENKQRNISALQRDSQKAESKSVLAMPNKNAWVLDLRGLSPTAATATIFDLPCQAAFGRRWNSDM